VEREGIGPAHTPSWVLETAHGPTLECHQLHSLTCSEQRAAISEPCAYRRQRGVEQLVQLRPHFFLPLAAEVQPVDEQLAPVAAALQQRPQVQHGHAARATHLWSVSVRVRVRPP
jgi:hypothetical protein